MAVMRHKTFRLSGRDMRIGRPRLVGPRRPRPWGLWDWLSMGIAAPPSPRERLLGRVEAFANEVGADNVVAINEHAGVGREVTVWYRVESAGCKKPYEASMAEL